VRASTPQWHGGPNAFDLFVSPKTANSAGLAEINDQCDLVMTDL
jgi:hypothetical protein